MIRSAPTQGTRDESQAAAAPGRGTPQLVLLAVVLLACLAAWQHLGRSGLVTVRSDGTGYYEYLPAILQYRDPWLQRLDQRPVNEPTATRANNTVLLPDGRRLIKYPIGTAMLWLPFYVAAHGVAALTERYPADSYSPPYMAAVSVAAATYLLLGVAMLGRFLRQTVGDGPAVLACALLVFGTNLFHYATYDASFSHVYGFALSSALVLLLGRLRARPTLDWALAGLAFGLLVSVRPTHAVAGPGLLHLLRRRRLGSARALMLAGAGAAAGLAPQLAYNLCAAGSPLLSVYGLRGETFAHAGRPWVLEVLLQPQHHGLLFWSPVLVAAAAALVWRALVPRHDMDRAGAVVIALQTLVIASWWQPGFGASFGHRGFVDFYPFLALPLAQALVWIGSRSRPVRAACGVLLGLAVAVSLGWMLSYWHGLLPSVAPSGLDAWRALRHWFAA